MAIHATDAAWAASDRDIYILQPVEVIFATDADIIFGLDVIGVTVTDGTAAKAIGNVIVLYADWFTAVGVIDTVPPWESRFERSLNQSPQVPLAFARKNNVSAAPAAMYRIVP